MRTKVKLLPKNFQSFLLKTGVAVGIVQTSNILKQIEVSSTTAYELSFENKYSLRKSKFSFGTVEHYLHCQSEFIRLNKLRDQVTGNLKDKLDYEIADVHLILEKYQ